jgi:transcriptional regulator with XRE-family HTH domain
MCNPLQKPTAKCYCSLHGSCVTHIGKLIEARRGQLGLSRFQLASRLGISSQTVLNLERDPTYNLGTSLLLRLEAALKVTFDITMKEEGMSTSIQIGNDEFILYIRKNHPNCTKSNDDLGKRIWAWIKKCDSTAVKAGSGDAVPCIWGDTGAHIGETKLPYKATQFRFERRLLPSLYDLLDALGSV